MSEQWMQANVENFHRSNELFQALITFTADEARRIVEAENGEGFHAWKALVQYYEPATKTLDIHVWTEFLKERSRAKTPAETKKKLLDIEEGISKIRATLSEAPQEKLLIGMVHSVMDHATFNALGKQLLCESMTYAETRDLVVSMCNATVNMHKVEAACVVEEEQNEWIEAVENRTCFYCGKAGHLQSECRLKFKNAASGKGTSKGKAASDNKGSGKGKSKGKDNWAKGNEQGKGKGGFGFYCYSCGGGGHIARNCWNGSQSWNQSTNSCSSTEPDEEGEKEDTGVLSTLKEVAQNEEEKWEVVSHKRKKQSLQPVAHVDGKENRMIELEMAVDSGATESVMPSNVMKHVPLSQNKEKAKTKYEVANGEILTNEGQKDMVVVTAQGKKKKLTMQVVNVNKPLLSVRRAIDGGNRIVFEKGWSYIENVSTGEKTWMEEKGGMFMLKVWVPREGFPGQD